MPASMAARCVGGQRARCASSRLRQAVVGVDAGGLEGGAVLGEDVGKNARTACPKMIGSDTFIIVALRWSEKSTPLALASAICSARNVEQRRLAHDRGVDDLAGVSTGIDVLQHGGGAVGGRRSSMRSVPSASAIVTDRSLSGSRRRPSWTTWVLESGDHAPIECGCLRAYCLHRRGRPAVGVALAEHRVHGAALDRVVAGPDVALGVVGRLVGVVGEGVALAPAARRWPPSAGGARR